MPRGGPRPGSGRPKGHSKPILDKLMAREALRQMVIANMEPMVKAQMQAAQGLNVAVIRRPDGTFRRVDSVEMLDQAIAEGAPMDIHTLQPSTQAFTDLMNRALDKPAESVEITGADKGPLIVRWEK